MDTIAEILGGTEYWIALMKIGAGGEFDLSKPLFSFPSIPLRPNMYGKQITETIAAVKKSAYRFNALPISMQERTCVARHCKFRVHKDDSRFHFLKFIQ